MLKRRNIPRRVISRCESERARLPPYACFLLTLPMFIFIISLQRRLPPRDMKSLYTTQPRAQQRVKAASGVAPRHPIVCAVYFITEAPCHHAHKTPAAAHILEEPYSIEWQKSQPSHLSLVLIIFLPTTSWFISPLSQGIWSPH